MSVFALHAHKMSHHHNGCCINPGCMHDARCTAWIERSHFKLALSSMSCQPLSPSRPTLNPKQTTHFFHARTDVSASSWYGVSLGAILHTRPAATRWKFIRRSGAPMPETCRGGATPLEKDWTFHGPRCRFRFQAALELPPGLPNARVDGAGSVSERWDEPAPRTPAPAPAGATSKRLRAGNSDSNQSELSGSN